MRILKNPGFEEKDLTGLDYLHFYWSTYTRNKRSLKPYMNKKFTVYQVVGI